MAVTVGALVGVGLSAYKAYKSAKQKKAAAEMEARLRQPAYKVQNEYLENKNLALQNAGQGYTSAAKDYLTTEAERGLGTGITAISSSGGGPNDISKLYSTYLRSIDQTAAQDSQIQLGNIQRLMEANKEIAGQKSIGWSLNEDRPFQTRRKELRQDQMIADSNMWQGLEGVAGSLSAYGTGQLNSGMIPRNQRQPAEQNFFSNAPVDTVSSQQPVSQVLRGRSSPTVSADGLNGPNSGGGGYYPGANDWQNALNLDYQ
jgi:hypothetical protein